MTNGEIINLVGIIIVFITTIIGWIVIPRIQSGSELKKEQLILISNERITQLKEIEDWVKKCREIFFESTNIVNKYDDIMVKTEKFKEQFSKIKEIRRDEPRLFYLSKIYDPIASNAKEWEWGEEELPKDLPQLIDAIENETFARVTEILIRDLDYPFIEGQFYKLYEEAIKSIERIRNELRGK